MNEKNSGHDVINKNSFQLISEEIDDRIQSNLLSQSVVKNYFKLLVLEMFNIILLIFFYFSFHLLERHNGIVCIKK